MDGATLRLVGHAGRPGSINRLFGSTPADLRSAPAAQQVRADGCHLWIAVIEASGADEGSKQPCCVFVVGVVSQQHPSRPFDAKNFDMAQTSSGELGAQLIRTV